MFKYILISCLVLAGCSSTKQAYIDHPVRVTGEGRTFEEAKKQAFSNAMEYAVGAVVVTDTQIQQKKLVKDEIIKHSSGYVEDYTVVKQNDGPSGVSVILDVKVKNSLIAERITNVRGASSDVKGEQVGSLHDTFMESKITGDQLLTSVLNDYPKKAFIVEKQTVQYMLNVNRQPVIVIPYRITWNYKYLQSLSEVLSITQDPKDLSIKQKRIDIISKDPSAWFLGSTDRYHFNDEIRTELIHKALRRTLFVQTVFKDSAGNIVKVGCDSGRNLNGVNQKNVFVVDGTEIIEEEVERTINANVDQIRRITTIEITVEDKPCTFIS